jgi:hypothetical protein
VAPMVLSRCFFCVCARASWPSLLLALRMLSLSLCHCSAGQDRQHSAAVITATRRSCGWFGLAEFCIRVAGVSTSSAGSMSCSRCCSVLVDRACPEPEAVVQHLWEGALHSWGQQCSCTGLCVCTVMLRPCCVCMSQASCGCLVCQVQHPVCIEVFNLHWCMQGAAVSSPLRCW